MQPFLPTLASIAAGGTSDSAIPITSGWILYRLAAKVLDDVLDGDAAANVPWGKWSKGRAMNVGVGLIFVAQSCLLRIQVGEVTQREIYQTISQALMFMTRGQAHPPQKPDLEDYLQYIYLKAGLPFGAFSWAGARLHTRNRRITRALFDFGSALGTLLPQVDSAV